MLIPNGADEATGIEKIPENNNLPTVQVPSKVLSKTGQTEEASPGREEVECESGDIGPAKEEKFDLIGGNSDEVAIAPEFEDDPADTATGTNIFPLRSTDRKFDLIGGNSDDEVAIATGFEEGGP